MLPNASPALPKEVGRPSAIQRTLRSITSALTVCMSLGSALHASEAKAFAVIESNCIVVVGLGARAVIDKTPFRLRFEDAQGRVVLREVENTRPAPVVFGQGETGPVFDPDPVGAPPTSGAFLYSPMFFEVGQQSLVTFASSIAQPSPWTGNMQYGARGGYIFAATDVVSAQLEGDGVRIVVASNDPQGRQLIVTVHPDGLNAIRVRATLSITAGVMNIGDAFVARADEAFHGFGGRHPDVNLRGRSFYSWAEQENLGGGIIELGAAAQLGPELAKEYLYPNGPMAAYYPQNSFVTSRPGTDAANGGDQAYGMLVANDEFTRWRVSSDPGRLDAYQFSVATTALDYTVAVGQRVDIPFLSNIAPETQVVATLTGINGRHRVAPAWSMGPTISRTVRIGDPVTGVGADTPETYLAKIYEDLEQIIPLSLKPNQPNRLPVTTYNFEGWDVLDPEVVRDIILRLKSRGIRAVLYIRPFFSNDGLLTERPTTFLEAVSQGFVTRTTAPTYEPYIWIYRGAAALLDLTNPAAVAWYKERLKAMLDLGADGFMLDFGEQVTTDMVFANGQTGLTMHNRYPILHAQVAREVTDAFEAAHPERGPLFFFNRAGYSGRPGSAASETSNFPGDETTDWVASSGLASVVPDMLNRAIGGAYGFNTDIGGYADFVPTFPGGTAGNPTSKELFIRWSQLAALTPFFRVHNSGAAGVRQPWSFAAQDTADGKPADYTLKLWRKSAELHNTAIPLIRRLWDLAKLTGVPMTRPLWLAYPDDVEAAKQKQEWMLGENVLVAPVFIEGATSRKVYFPKGCWKGPGPNGITVDTQTGVERTVDAPLEVLPYFIRCGKSLTGF